MGWAAGKEGTAEWLVVRGWIGSLNGTVGAGLMLACWPGNQACPYGTWKGSGELLLEGSRWSMEDYAAAAGLVEVLTILAGCRA